jgi:hypothetical protein
MSFHFLSPHIPNQFFGAPLNLVFWRKKSFPAVVVNDAGIIKLAGQSRAILAMLRTVPFGQGERFFLLHENGCLVFPFRVIGADFKFHFGNFTSTLKGWPEHLKCIAPLPL